MSQIFTRRTILSAAGTGAVAAAFVPQGLASAPLQGEVRESGTKKRLLMLGGTVFLGPQIVQAALDAGWDVTLFNRGKSGPDVFPDLDARIGDRNTGDYASLATGEWDLCIDTSCYIPAHVTAAIEALTGRVKHYLVVSTISVYADDQPGESGPVLEDGKIATIPEELIADFQKISDIGKHGSRYYGALKALCESAAQEAMPEGGVTIVRPGLIVGPEDRSDRYTYWPVRVAKGGEVLAPGNPENGVQYVDVRDLGVFTFDVGARVTGKTYNATGFDRKVTFKELIESCIPQNHGKPKDLTITWVDGDFLLEQGVGQWKEMPLWIHGGGHHYVNDLAREDGLKFRPLSKTAAATLRWHGAERGDDHQWGAGLAADKEANVLAAWHAREKKK